MAARPHAKKQSRSRSEVTHAAASNLLDTKRLFYFFHVARTGSFTSAEAALDVAQSALSRQISQLESDLDVKLLERRGHGVELTETGKIFYSHSEQLLASMGEALAEVERLKSAPRDRIALAASRPFSTRVLPRVLLEFGRRHPHIHMTVFEASSGQVYEMLAGGKVDLAVVLHQPNSPKIVSTKLLDEELLLCTRADNPAVRSKSEIARSELPSLRVMLPAAQFGTRGILERYFEQGGLKIDPVFRTDSVSLMMEIIRLDGYSAILPRMAVEEELASGEFVALPLEPRLMRTLHLSHLRDGRQAEASEAMRVAILDAVRRSGER